MLLLNLCTQKTEVRMWWLSLWSRSSLHRLVYQEDFEGSGGALICMSMSVSVAKSPKAVEIVSIINLVGGIVPVTLFAVRMDWRTRHSAAPLWKKKISRRKRWWKWVTYDYFYGQQSELFTFYRVPKVLFTNERFWNISADAKMLYGKGCVHQVCESS